MSQASFAARYQSDDLPSSISSDACLLLNIECSNLGQLAWQSKGPQPITISYRWHDRNGRPIIAEGLHSELPGIIAPGESCKLRIAIEPPARPGDYLVTVDLIQEGVAWFSELGVQPLQFPIRVTAPREVVQRVTIVMIDTRLHDAMGNYLVEKLRFFKERGAQVLALVEHLDERQPDWVRELLFRVRLSDLQGAGDNPLTRRAYEHFYSSNLFIFNYPTYYQLIEAIRLVQGGQVIFDYHGVTPPQLWGDARGLDDLVRGQQQASLVRYADHAIAHSSYARDELARHSGIDPSEIKLLSYVVPIETFKPGQRDPKLVKQYGLEGKQVLLYIGRMAANKRVIDLVRALPLIQRDCPNAVLMIVGDIKTQPYPQLVAEAKQTAEQLGVGASLIFTGQVDDLPAYYQLCDLFVTASQHEGFCIPVIEAEASGKPVVGSAATALPETIGPGGLTFPVGDLEAFAASVVQLLNSRKQG